MNPVKRLRWTAFSAFAAMLIASCAPDYVAHLGAQIAKVLEAPSWPQ